MELINKFIQDIFCNERFNDVGKLMEKIFRDNQFSQKFIEILQRVQREKGRSSFIFLNYDNMMDLANILTTITLSMESRKHNLFDLNFEVIYLSENSYFQKDNDTKIFLCSVISRNKIYSSKLFWKEMIELKIEKHVSTLKTGRFLSHKEDSKEEKYTKPQLDSIKEKKEKDFVNNETEMNVINNTTATEDGFEMVSSALSNSPKSTNIKVSYGYDSKQRPKSFDDTNTNINNNHSNVTSNKNIPQVLNQSTLSVCTILKEFINHFANFDFCIHQAIDIIVEISTKYNIPRERISFFVLLLNSAVYTVKSKGTMTPCKANYFKKYGSRLGILYSLPGFLQGNEILNVLLLNKQTNKVNQKHLYKHILLETDPSFQVRKQIWHNLLKTVSLI